MIRFGDRFIVSTRLGVGILLASYDSTFTTGGTSMDGPGDGLEVDGVWSVGGGFDARLGEHWGLGVATTLAVAFKSEARSLEAGLHLGYPYPIIVRAEREPRWISPSGDRRLFLKCTVPHKGRVEPDGRGSLTVGGVREKGMSTPSYL